MATIEDINKCIQNNNIKLADRITADIKSEIESTRADLSAKIDDFANKFSSQIKAVECTTSLLQEKIAQLDDKIARMSKMCSLVVRNIPSVTGENLDDIFNSICGKIGYNIPVPFPKIFRAISKNKSTQIARSFDQMPLPTGRSTRRTKPSASGSTAAAPLLSEGETVNSPLIIIKFVCDWHKIEFHRAYFKHGKLQLSDIGFLAPTQIVIAEDLTEDNRKIFREALLAKRKGLLSKVLTSNGLVCVFDMKGIFVKLQSVKHLSEVTKPI